MGEDHRITNEERLGKILGQLERLSELLSGQGTISNRAAIAGAIIACLAIGGTFIHFQITIYSMINEQRVKGEEQVRSLRQELGALKRRHQSELEEHDADPWHKEAGKMFQKHERELGRCCEGKLGRSY